MIGVGASLVAAVDTVQVVAVARVVVELVVGLTEVGDWAVAIAAAGIVLVVVGVAPAVEVVARRVAGVAAVVASSPGVLVAVVVASSEPVAEEVVDVLVFVVVANLTAGVVVGIGPAREFVKADSAWVVALVADTLVVAIPASRAALVGRNIVEALWFVDIVSL